MNSPSQKLTGTPGPATGSSKRAGIETGYATDGEKGAHSDSPADARATQFSPDDHDKTPNTIAAM
jgi:hypothetical protein